MAHLRAHMDDNIAMMVDADGSFFLPDEFVVRACNCHDELLAACKDLNANWCDNGSYSGPDDPQAIKRFSKRTIDIWRKVRNAIAKAESE
jgi:hypothetical protein